MARLMATPEPRGAENAAGLIEATAIWLALALVGAIMLRVL